MIALWFMGAALASSTADEALDPAHAIIDRLSRARGADVLYGARTSSIKSLLVQWDRLNVSDAEIERVLAPERSEKPYALRPGGRIVAGDLMPEYQQGDQELGWVGIRAQLDARAYWRSLEVMTRPEFRMDETSPSAALPLGWLGLHTEQWRVGFGLEERWVGPGRHGGLMLTDHARPAPLGTLAFEDRLGERWGRLRAEVGAGWLDAPRTDVERPGWLLMDFRWAPIPAIEMGLSRMSIFGGVERPSPNFGQLLLPTKPHVSNDPDQRLPDQDEIAALDLRVTLPVGNWLRGPRTDAGSGFALDYLEVWTQYGGEDVIARSIGPIPVPALAGIANLWGGELGLGDFTANLEWARVMDDQFRWYTGHRIYHEGFVQDGLSMGHAGGGDSRSWNMGLRWLPGRWGAELNAQDRLRVGGIDVAQGRLRTLSNDEKARSVGARAWWLGDGTAWWHAGIAVEQTENPGFQPVSPQRTWRVHLGR